MIIEQKIASGFAAGKSLMAFFNFYARFLISYPVAVFFIIFGIIFFSDKILVRTQTKLIFLGLAILLLIISYLIHKVEIIGWKTIKLIILLGNIFGFLFNFIYFLVKICNDIGYYITLGGAEKFVFSINKPGAFNLIELMYGFVGGIIFILSLSLFAIYGLDLKDKYLKEGKKIKAALSIILCICAAFIFFLLFLFFQTTFNYILYFITGSMLYIYGVNLFKKDSIYIKF